MLRRGHVEVTLQVERRTTAQIQLNAELLSDYMQALPRGSGTNGLAYEPDLNAMLRIPGMMSVESYARSGRVAPSWMQLCWRVVPLVEKLNEGRAA